MTFYQLRKNVESIDCDEDGDYNVILVESARSSIVVGDAFEGTHGLRECLEGLN